MAEDVPRSVYESVKNLLDRARHNARVWKAERDRAVAENERLRAGILALVEESTPWPRPVMFGGEPFPVSVPADRLLALLDGDD